MNVKHLIVKDILKIKTVEITPDGQVVKLSGANESGKTSIFRSIEIAADGAKALKKIPKPVRDGAEKGTIELTLGEGEEQIIIKRVVHPNGKSEVQITNSKGLKFPSPQKVLDSLRSRVSFDPLDFVSMSGNEQANTVLSSMGIKDQLQEIAELRKEEYDFRTVINRTLKEKEVQRNATLHVPQDLPKEPISISELILELNKAESQQNENERKKLQYESMIDSIKREVDELDKLVKMVQDKKDRIAHLKQECDEFGCSMFPLPDISPSLEEIKQQITDAEEINRKIQRRDKQEELNNEIDELKRQRDEQTENIKFYDDKRVQLIRDAGMPLPGLSFMEDINDGLTYNGIPLTQLSTGEAIRVSTKILMGLNPQIGVIWVKNGSLLDQKNMEAILSSIKESGREDFQLWLEIVSEAQDVGIVIEEGEIVKVNP